MIIERIEKLVAPLLSNDARLRLALERIANLENHDDYREGFEPLLDDAIEIAKKALT